MCECSATECTRQKTVAALNHHMTLLVISCSTCIAVLQQLPTGVCVCVGVRVRVGMYVCVCVSVCLSGSLWGSLNKKTRLF